MKSLAQKNHWDKIYQKNYSLINKISNLSIFESYYYYALFSLLQRFLSKEYRSIIEVGCAPGNYLVKFYKKFSLEPFGIEYAEDGYRKTVENLRAYGVAENNIFLADFFDDSFLNNQMNSFDVVFSAGFIEHFPNPELIVKRHMSLVREGGLLICLIPNVRYMNAILTPKSIIDIHNLSIMNQTSFRKIFDGCGDILYCDYFGGLFNFGLYNYENPILRLIRIIAYVAQRILVDPILKLLFLIRGKDCTSKYWSPSLLCVIKK